MNSMKKYIIGLFVLAVFASCEEWTNSAEKSAITYLPLIEVIGESDITLDCDAAGYEDEGAIANEGPETIEYETTVSPNYFGDVTISGPDKYQIAYSAVNKDGIPGSAFRYVYWPECNGDLTTSIAGVYTADVTRNGVITPQYMGLGPIIIKDLGNGEYQLSDAIGGYYDYGRAYGYTYASTGMIITANNIPANDFTYGDPVPVGAFGGVNVMKTFTVNAAAKTINFTTEWDAGFNFSVKLTLQE